MTAEHLVGEESADFYVALGKEDVETQNPIDIGSLVFVSGHFELDPERVYMVTRMDSKGNCYLSFGGGELPEPFDPQDLNLFMDPFSVDEKYIDGNTPNNKLGHA